MKIPLTSSLVIFFLLFFSNNSFSRDNVDQNSKSKNYEDCVSILESSTLEDLSSPELQILLVDYKNCESVTNEFTDEQKLKFYHNYSELYLLNDDLDNAIKTQQFILDKLNIPHQDSLSVLAHLQMYYEITNKPAKYIEISNEIQQISKDSTNHNFRFDISKLYANNNAYDKAIESWLLESKACHQHHGYSQWFLLQENNLGYYYYKNNQLDSAENILNRVKNKINNSDRFKSEIQRNYYLGQVNGNLSKLYFTTNQPDKAVSLLKQKIDSAEKYNDTNSALEAKLDLFHYYVSSKLNVEPELVDAVQNLDSNSLTTQQKLSKHLSLAEHYQSIGNFQESNKHYTLLIPAIEEKVENDKAATLSYLNLAQKKFEFEKEQGQVEFSKEKSKINQNINRLILGIVGATLFGLFLFIISDSKKNKIVRKNLSKIETQNQIINKAFKRNSFLLKELNHRVKNNLQVISGILSIEEKQTNNEELIAITKKTRNRINSIALIHQQFIDQEFEQSLDVSSYFLTIISSTIESFGFSNKVDVETKIKVGNIHLDVISPLGLIVNELVTNSCKHAFPFKDAPKLFLSFVENANEFVFTYQDNGPGFENNESKKTIGLQLVPGLARQIDGEMTMNSDDGFLCEIKIKK